MCRMLEFFYLRTPLDQYLSPIETWWVVPTGGWESYFDSRQAQSLAENQILTLPCEQRDCLPWIQSPNVFRVLRILPKLSNLNRYSSPASLNLKKPCGKRGKSISSNYNRNAQSFTRISLNIEIFLFFILCLLSIPTDPPGRYRQAVLAVTDRPSWPSPTDRPGRHRQASFLPRFYLVSVTKFWLVSGSFLARFWPSPYAFLDAFHSNIDFLIVCSPSRRFFERMLCDDILCDDVLCDDVLCDDMLRRTLYLNQSL